MGKKVNICLEQCLLQNRQVTKQTQFMAVSKPYVLTTDTGNSKTNQKWDRPIKSHSPKIWRISPLREAGGYNMGSREAKR